MKNRPYFTNNASEQEIHSYYTKILSFMPYLVYWVDEQCSLQGFNAKFGELLEMYSPEECAYDPYSKLTKALGLSKSYAESLKLDDMAVIFSGKPKHNLEIISPKSKNNPEIKYTCNRDPIIDKTGKVIGAVIVIMNKNDLVTEKLIQVETKDRTKNTIKPRVLVVEDNATALKVEESIFKALNCIVDSVSTGNEALNLFKPGKYNLVMMDIGLEDSSGYFLCRKFRKMEENTDFHAVIIALTSFKPEDVKDDCKYYNMEGVVGKPLEQDQADQIIQHYIYNNGNAINGLNVSTF